MFSCVSEYNDVGRGGFNYRAKQDGNRIDSFSRSTDVNFQNLNKYRALGIILYHFFGCVC